MYCTNCGKELQEADRFCPACGQSVGGTPVTPAPGPKLARLMYDKKIAGVCSGFARYLGVDVTLVRLLWIVVTLVVGTGLIAYIVAWIVMPAEYAVPAAPAVTHTNSAPVV